MKLGMCNTEEMKIFLKEAINIFVAEDGSVGYDLLRRTSPVKYINSSSNLYQIFVLCKKQLKSKLLSDILIVLCFLIGWAFLKLPAHAQATTSIEVQKYINGMKSPDIRYRISAVKSLGKIGPSAFPAVPSLMKALSDKSVSVRFYAADALREIGPAAVSSLIKALSDKNDEVRSHAASALGDIPAAVPSLMRALSDKDVQIRTAADSILDDIGPAAVPFLMKSLSDKDVQIRVYASSYLGKIGPQASRAVPSLMRALSDENDDVRASAADSLGKIGPSASAAIPLLIKALSDKTDFVRADAANSLGKIGPSASAAVPSLIKALSDKTDSVRSFAIESLGKIGPSASAAVPSLANALSDKDVSVRRFAAQALGKIGSSASDAVPDLVKSLSYKDTDARRYAIESILAISTSLSYDAPKLSDTQLRDGIGYLDKAEKDLVPFLNDNDFNVNSIRQLQGGIRGAHSTLDRVYSGNFWNRVPKWIKTNPLVAGFIIAIACAWITTFLLLWLRPLALLAFNDGLKQIPDIGFLPPFNGIKVGAGYLLGPGFFHYHPSVLDAYVKNYAKIVKGNLYKRPTFAARKVYVDIPLTFPEPTGDKRPAPSDFHTVFNGNNAIVRLWGEGGSGKTTLACQMALWALAENPNERLCRAHQMLPVVIEANLPGAKAGDSSPLLKEICGNLRLLIGEDASPSEELVKNLLQQRRILLSVDGYTELDEATRSIIRPNDHTLSLNALLVTSRSKDTLNTGDGLTLQTGLLKHEGIAVFIADYLKQSGLDEPLKNGEFYDEMNRFTILVGDREITALMAQLYAQYLIDSRQNTKIERPKNLPELMGSYVTRMHGKVSAPTYSPLLTYQLACKIAWTGLEDSLTPTETPENKIREALARAEDGISLPAANPDPNTATAFFVDTLNLLRRPDSTTPVLKFVLDPLFEYLAARYLVTYHCGKDASKWDNFFAAAELKPGAPQSIAGFLRALADTVEAKGKESSVPDFVLPKLKALLPQIPSVALPQPNIEEVAPATAAP